MKIFVIGATGYIGSHVATRLVAGGHDVTGFARDTSGAAKVSALGATPFVGDVEDLPVLIAQAQAADITIFAPQLSPEGEASTVAALLEGLKDTGKGFIFTSGTGVVSIRTGGEWDERSFAEDDAFTPLKFIAGRVDTEGLVRAAAERGVRGMVVRPPAIWGNGSHGITDLTVKSVRVTGSACYIGRGLGLYSHVHVEDLADLYARVAENGQAGALYHAVAGEVNNRCIAELVGKRLGVPTRSVGMDEAVSLWGKFFTLVVLSISSRTRSPRSRDELGWAPTKVELEEEILTGDILSLSRFPEAHGRV